MAKNVVLLLFDTSAAYDTEWQIASPVISDSKRNYSAVIYFSSYDPRTKSIPE